MQLVQLVERFLILFLSHSILGAQLWFYSLPLLLGHPYEFAPETSLEDLGLPQ